MAWWGFQDCLEACEQSLSLAEPAKRVTVGRDALVRSVRLELEMDRNERL